MNGPARSQNIVDTDVVQIPSVPEILEAIGAEAELGAFDDDLFNPDEQEATREVEKAMTKVRPLLRQYRQQHRDLAGRLSRARDMAASASLGAIERSQDHLRTFDRLRESCVAVSRDLDLAAAESSGNEQNEVGSGGKKDAARRAAAEADELVSRHRSLVQRRRRMRSALQVLEVSEKARIALESAGQPGRRWERTDEAMKAVDLLRGLLGKHHGLPASGNPATAPRSRSVTTATRTATAGAAMRPTILSDDANGELTRVACGRLEWLTRRLRAELSSELGCALREADPLSAAAATADDSATKNGVGGGGAEEGRGREQGTVGLPDSDEERRREGLARVESAVERLLLLQFGGNGKVEGGTVWALDGLLEPVAVRFRFHFEGDRPTNRVDRPEWFLSFLLRALEAYLPLLTGDVRPDGVDRLAYFARGLALLARRRLRAQLCAVASDDSLLSHTVEEALAFDQHLDRVAGYAECPTKFPRQAWPRCVEVFAQDDERFRRWMESDAEAAEAKLAEAAAAPGAWRAIGWKHGPKSSIPTTPSAVAVCRIFSDLTERYRPLRDPSKQLRFARTVQAPILRAYSEILYRRASECGPNSVFRDEGEQTGGIMASWSAALGAAMGPGQGQEDTSPIGRWRSYCLAVSSCAYVRAVLRDSEDNLLFAEMGQAAAAAAAAAVAAVSSEAGGVGGSTSLEAVGEAVGAAVEGVVTTAETATAEVVRAVGAQGTIIGPTHAISAAFTSIKGAARRARRTSPASHGDVTEAANGNVNSNGNGAGNGNGVPGIEVGARGQVAPESSCGSAAAENVVGRSRNGTGVVTPGASEEEGARTRGDRNGNIISGGGRMGASVDARPHCRLGGEGGLYGIFPGGHESIFGEEVGRYGDILDALMREAVSSCRDGFLVCTRSYLRAWDRGIAVVVPALWASAAAVAAEPSGRLAAGVELLGTALAVAEDFLPSDLYQSLWTLLARELDTALAMQIVGRTAEMTQDEGLQLRADLKALMGPFSVSARHRPEKHFPELIESALLLSLEKSQLRSLAAGLEAHGGGVGDSHRGAGWEGWLEESGALSPEGTQMRDMLENVGVRCLGPIEASFLLDKRLKGDQRAALRHHSAAAAVAAAAIADIEGSGSPPSSSKGMERGGVVADDARGDRASSSGRLETAGELSAALRETALRSYG